ncbi:hypothetical protein LINPERPRIM_LOCUS20197 [Linum perenne]
MSCVFNNDLMRAELKPDPGLVIDDNDWPDFRDSGTTTPNTPPSLASSAKKQKSGKSQVEEGKRIKANGDHHHSNSNSNNKKENLRESSKENLKVTDD